MKPNGLLVPVTLMLMGVSGHSVADADPKPLRELTEADAAAWKAIGTVPPLLTPDGKWLAYLLVPDPDAAFDLHPHIEPTGEVIVVLRSIEGKIERRYSAGELSYGAGRLKMSASGRWLAFMKTPTREAGEKLKAAGQSVRNSVVLWNIARDEKTELQEAVDFSFLGGRDQHLLIKHYPSVGNAKVFDVTLRSLEGTGLQTFSGISAYAVNPRNTRLVLIDTQGVQLRDLTTGVMQKFDATPGYTYSETTWSGEGEALAMLRTNTAGTDGALVSFTQLAGSQAQMTVLDSRKWAGFPQGYELAAPLLWRNTEDGVFFNIRALPGKPTQQESVANLVLWHSQDERLPVERQADARKRPSYWCFASLIDRRFIRLADEQLSTVEPHARAPYVLGYDTRPYGWLNPRDGTPSSQTRDYYRVDLQTGERKLLFKGLQTATRLMAYPRLSPDGSVVVYVDKAGDYIAYGMLNGEQHNLTAGLPARFYLKENDPKTRRQMKDPPAAHGIQGWTNDGASVLISDYYDVWQLPLHGGQAVNLTGNGRKDDINYGLSSLSLSDDLTFTPDMSPTFPLNEIQEGRIGLSPDTTFYFSALDFKTGKRGLARRVPGQDPLELMMWDDAYAWYFKAKKSEVYIYMRMTAVEPWNYYLLDKFFHVKKRLTDVNPQQREFQWSPDSKYLTYKTAHGDILHAALYLPVNFVRGRSYPTVTWIYRDMTPRVHDYRPFISDLYPWLQRGYAVLEPDILPRINESGQAALESVTGAVDAAVATGVVDRNRLGLGGHSFGGWETYFIASQTDLFKAAVPYAGMTNLWSNYGVLNGMRPNSRLSEVDQPFLAGPWWEHWDAYLQNSPLYHARQIKTPLLMVHGDKDSAVPFSQAVEMFNSLRRMGNKQVVLLQYVGEEHNLDQGDGRAERDFQRRMQQFFDHFLKGAPAPSWWADGLSLYQGQTPSPGSVISSSRDLH